MDNNELDKILKEKLKDSIKPTAEFENKIKAKVEEEKRKFIENNNRLQVDENENNNQLKNNDSKKSNSKKVKRFVQILSMAAVIMIVFALGTNINNIPIIGETQDINLISISAIEPTKSEGGIIANNSEFTILAEGENLNKEIIRQSLYVEPALDYTIEETSNKNEYKLKFKQNIPDNTIVKLQYVKNQITENSWAYQTSNKLSITSTYPENNSTDISEKTVIDVVLSYANVENFEENVSISPNVEGTWNHLGKTWRFTPNEALKDKQEYIVKIGKDIIADGQNLENDYIFKFQVGNTYDSVTYTSISMDGIITIKPDEFAKITYQAYEETDFGKIEIGKFNNVNDFMTYVEDNNQYKLSVRQGEVKFNDNGKYLELRKNLEVGYYVARVTNTNGTELFNCPIQVSEYSSYAMQTERDVLVWVAKGENLASNIPTEYQGKTINTDSNGIAKFEGVADNSEKIKYVKVGNELLIGVYNYSLDNYPSGYIYTDRPMYKNTDTINIWGFVPRKLFYDKIDEEFYIELNNEGRQKINVSEDGIFEYQIDLKNHISEEGTSICLYYKEKIIASRTITIQNYELQNYTYEVIKEKEYGKVGEDYSFDVKVKHITGLVVPNKKVTIKLGNTIDTKLTGEDGIAHFTVKLEVTEYDKKGTYPSYQEVDIFNGDENEYTTADNFFSIPVLKGNTYAEIQNEANNYKLTIQKLDDTRNTKLSYDLKELYDGPYETTVQINLKEMKTSRYITGYEYNPYTKENEPRYQLGETNENITKIKTVTSTNGIAEIDESEFKLKKDTDDVTYSYIIQFVYNDLSGREVKEEMYVSNYMSENKLGYISFDSIYEEIHDSSDRIYEAISGIDLKYYIYRYLFNFQEKENYAIGDNIAFTLAESTVDGIKEIENDGKLLTITFKEDISEAELLSENKFTHEFKEDDFPGFKITGAYFLNGKFYRMPIKYFDFDEETRKVDIEITPDKEQYEPGDTVNLNIKTTNNKNPIKTTVNISVANEALFELEEDTTNIMEEIYADKDYAVYTFSSYFDYINEIIDGGAGGGDGYPRSQFADTACFKTVTTDRSGTAKISFKLPDNVTTYRVTAHAVNEDLYVGVNTINITSTLDFFVQSTEPRGIKTTDDVVLNATSISDTRFDVDYEFTIKELAKTLNETGTTNNLVTVNFGSLPAGKYHAIIKGQNGEQKDSIEYEFEVVESVQEVAKKTEMNITNNQTIKPSKNPIKMEIYNKDMSKYIKYIDFIESTVTERLDTQIAYNKVQEVKEKYYGTNNSSINQIMMYSYEGENFYLKNLRGGKEDLVLTALTKYYAKEYANFGYGNISEKDNLFEYYLIKSAENEPVLQDLLYLKEENDISNYDKLLITLSLEFMGDYQNARDLYKTISLSEEEAEEYKSIIAIIDTFINKSESEVKINQLIENSPADEYLRFAILSYFQNNSNELEKTDTLRIKAENLNETITVNGMQVKTLTVYDDDLSDIAFETESQDLMIAYYYQTLLEDIEDESISKDIKTSIDGDLIKGNTVTLNIRFDGNYEGKVKIALPNSLRLAKNYNVFSYDEENKFFVQNNHIDYITVYKMKDCKTIKLPMIVTNEGKYKLESIVSKTDDIYHISNSIDFEVKK